MNRPKSGPRVGISIDVDGIWMMKIYMGGIDERMFN
jgi:hypothetical protein